MGSLVSLVNLEAGVIFFGVITVYF
ncbi:hypothetical protein MPNT_50041 [Candidatus Methylacidithermus pantelleriae]|uniref:Uncharacterized protein n=1 Tax=Candidatus Methylacidithermus pantelleriae TaxID=2744239 RepID=A0A8J2BMJ2_9BACT|nr:hypothetical protein MPNT_50041 [Candidatus Methylacidithermus pantelleriae]